MTDERIPPLPAPDYPAGSAGMLGQDCYTADQMRAYGAECAAAERERCDEIARAALDAATEGDWMQAAVLLHRILRNG